MQLVQLGYRGVLNSPVNQGKLSDEELEAFAVVRPGSTCTGREDDALVRAIRAHQRSRGGIQDGVVSPLSQGHVSFSSGGRTLGLILVALNNSLRDVLTDRYPRIDTHVQCPPELKALSRATFGLS